MSSVADRLRALLQRRGARPAALILGLAAVAIVVWELRVLFRPLYMLFVIRHPALLSIPVLAGAAALAVHALVLVAKGRSPKATRAGPKATRKVDGKRSRRRRSRVPRRLHRALLSGVVAAVLGLVFAAAMTGYWTKAALYDHTRYGTLDIDELQSSEVRIKPYMVALHQMQNGLNSSTERPSNLHIIKVNGRLVWTSVRDPEGIFRVLTKPTRGVMSVAATASAPHARLAGRSYDAVFRFGPGMRISENIRWQIYKHRCYTCDVAELVGVPTADGPVIVAPYVRYKGGVFVRRPVFGGVFVVRPSGRLDDLTPQEAARDPLLRSTGRIFPEKLARAIADAYQLKNGMTNRLFVHEDQLHVADTEQNRQPFLEDFARIGTRWVTTLKPRGKTFTTAAIMTTDAITGATRIWRPPKSRSLIGNVRALDIVRGETFPGIVFAPPGASVLAGRFSVVEPRQVILDGRLHFLCSIIPDGGSRVTMSVLVDAESQQIARSFPATPRGDADLIEALRRERPATTAPQTPTTQPDTTAPPGGGRPRPAPGDTTPPAPDRDVIATLRRLLEDNRSEQRRSTERTADLKAQERELERLLREARRGG